MHQSVRPVDEILPCNDFIFSRMGVIIILIYECSDVDYVLTVCILSEGTWIGACKAGFLVFIIFDFFPLDVIQKPKNICKCNSRSI